MAKFILIDSTQPHGAQEIDLTPETRLNQECLLGRDPRCCLVLKDPLASHQHGRIFDQQGQYYYQDLGSRNGSRINNEAVQPSQSYCLKPLDAIQIGPYTLLVQALPEAAVADDRPPEPSDYMPLATIEPGEIHRWSEGNLTVRCVRVVEESADVKTFVFVASPPRLFTYQPGQFVSLELEIEGKTVRRSYSISSTPSRPHSLEITVKRVAAPADQPDAPPGLVSNWLHDHLVVGSEVKLTGPMGKFTCFANPSPKLLLVSAGSGITPMMSMSRWIGDTASDVDVVFLHSARTPNDIIFRQELESMAARHPNFKLAVTTTRSQPGQAWWGYRGRINEAMLQAIAPDYRDRTVYVCGPNPFMAGVKEMLEAMDFPMENFYEESFGGPKPVKKQSKSDLPPPSPGQMQSSATGFGLVSLLGQGPESDPKPESPSHVNQTTSIAVAAPPTTVVVFEQSGKEAIAEETDTILELAEQEGVDIRSGCRMGSCGACAAKLLSGAVEYASEPTALSNSDRADGKILTCIAHPKGRAIVDA